MSETVIERIPVPILYTNWRGETAVRKIVPHTRHPVVSGKPSLWFGSTQWHPEPQWLLTAVDVEKGAVRDWALSGIKAWGEEAVSAALASTARAGAGDWVPFETAPKDGSPVDLWIADPKSPKGGYREANARWTIPDHTCGDAGRYCDSCPPKGEQWCDEFGRWIETADLVEGGFQITHWFRHAPPGQSPAVPASPISTGEETRDDIQCVCVSTFGPNPECGRCGGSGCYGASPPAPAEHGVEIRELSEKATQGVWVFERTTPKFCGLYSDDATGSVIAKFSGFDYAPRPAEEQDANAKLSAALVNAYRAGELIHRSETGGQGAGRAGEGRDLERVRHVKRGTEYEVLGEAEAQVSYDRIGAAHRVGRPLWDENRLTVYRCLKTGKLWCQFTDEFRDGRFVPAAPAQSPSTSDREG